MAIATRARPKRVAEDEEPAREVPDLAVRAQDGKVGGQVLDRRGRHSVVEADPMGTGFVP